MAKTYTCPNCRKRQKRIGVVSEATQTMLVEDPTSPWEDLEVGDTLYGYCINCGHRITEKNLERILKS